MMHQGFKARNRISMCARQEAQQEGPGESRRGLGVRRLRVERYVVGVGVGVRVKVAVGVGVWVGVLVGVGVWVWIAGATIAPAL